jgi:CopG family nickel-responsive transcriptional regulator
MPRKSFTEGQIVYALRHTEAGTVTAIQHQHNAAILSTLHIHLDAHLCLEVLVLRGAAPVIRRISEALIGMRGVKHGKLA